MKPTTDIPPDLGDRGLDSLVETLRALADPTRIRLIGLLERQGRSNVGALADSLPLSRQGVSRQLGVLARAGMVSRRREGMCVFYELADWTAPWIIGQLVAEVRER